MHLVSGATRTVLVTKHWAFKFPRFGPYRNFLQGLLGNMQECDFATMRDPRFCPVLFGLPGGWLVVMPSLSPISDEQWQSILQATEWKWTEAVECKRSSFGVYKGAIVALDYGT